MYKKSYTIFPFSHNNYLSHLYKLLDIIFTCISADHKRVRGKDNVNYKYLEELKYKLLKKFENKFKF